MINLDMSDEQDKNVLDLIEVLLQLLEVKKNHYEMIDIILQQAIITAKELKSKK